MSKILQSALLEEPGVFASSLASKNLLLSQLFETERTRDYLLPHLKTVALEPNQVVYEQGDRIESVYFPLDSVVSNLSIMEDGSTLETSIIGREALVGISAVLGGRGISRHWLWVTISGTALQLDVKLADKLFVQSEDALKALLRCYRSMITQVSQRCVCNTRHTVLERLCYWLLMIHDRVGDCNLRLTQEMIASRLGARRAGVTVAAGLLQTMRAIEYRRGQLHIVDREVLEQAVCECYALMRNELTFRSPQSRLQVSL